MEWNRWWGANLRTVRTSVRNQTLGKRRARPPRMEHSAGRTPFAPEAWRQSHCGFIATRVISPEPRLRVQSQHGAKSTIAIGICCTPKNRLTWQLSAVVRSSSKASVTSSDHPQRPAIVRTSPIDLAFAPTCHWLNPRVADEAVYVVNASRVRVHGMEGIDITCLICHSLPIRSRAWSASATITYAWRPVWRRESPRH